MPKTEQIKPPEEKQFEKFVRNYIDVFRDENIPDICKMFLRQKDILLVIGGLKPITDIELDPEIINQWAKKGYWQNESQNRLKQILKEKFNIQATENVKRPDDLIKFNVYDPEQIKMRIKEFPDLLAWNDAGNLEKWRLANLNAGKNIDYLNGILYGFPKAAIEFYIKHKDLENISSQMVESGGEAYGIEKGVMHKDVSLREKQKIDFFQRIARNQDIQREFDRLTKIKDELVAIRNEAILKRTKSKVDTSKVYE